MRTISLRAFRVQVPELAEPVTVVMRREGELVTLGTWAPTRAGTLAAAIAAGLSTPLTDAERATATEYANRVLPVDTRSFSTRPFTPVPKKR